MEKEIEVKNECAHSGCQHRLTGIADESDGLKLSKRVFYNKGGEFGLSNMDNSELLYSIGPSTRLILEVGFDNLSIFVHEVSYVEQTYL